MAHAQCDNLPRHFPLMCVLEFAFIPFFETAMKNPIRLVRLIGLLGLLATSGGVLAHDYKAGELHIMHPWARPLPAVAPNGGAFVTIMNHGAQADRLLGARTERAAVTEIHTMEHHDGLMKMRQLEAVDIPANGQVQLQPGAQHLMLMGLKQPLEAGTSFPLTLIFEHAGEVTVEIKVEQPVDAPVADSNDAHQNH
ncbi:copper chaperone PCu(A)C [Atopomonas sediminilitoris]|uniref:copper chaperone PCu(A)C n=1 Tax=Atopomonas sediminilitoris TaxID=2919919 RepID=UPI001F4ED5AE|nr:copper chaperone PCu(A)C [Atopomonas sediminilitoris]MCJ8169481.1 copper chaperone PCu(A)C [Atopomonas sediminilitoris]